jgi:hypothetical protein
LVACEACSCSVKCGTTTISRFITCASFPSLTLPPCHSRNLLSAVNAWTRSNVASRVLGRQAPRRRLRLRGCGRYGLEICERLEFCRAYSASNWQY